MLRLIHARLWVIRIKPKGLPQFWSAGDGCIMRKSEDLSSSACSFNSSRVHLVCSTFRSFCHKAPWSGVGRRPA